MKILAISGSLRKDSMNMAALRTLQQRAPEGVEVTLADYGDVPLYNGDLEADGTPTGVEAFRAAITEADAVIISTPEYNYSVPGVLKNALDWASRPAFNSSLTRKKVAVMSVSPAFTGGVRAQAHLKYILSGIQSDQIPMGEVVIGSAHTQIEGGVITNEATVGHLDKMLSTIIDNVNAG